MSVIFSCKQKLWKLPYPTTKNIFTAFCSVLFEKSWSQIHRQWRPSIHTLSLFLVITRDKRDLIKTWRLIHPVSKHLSKCRLISSSPLEMIHLNNQTLVMKLWRKIVMLETMWENTWCEVDAEQWFTCGKCQRKLATIECIGCKEVDETKKIVSQLSCFC